MFLCRLAGDLRHPVQPRPACEDVARLVVCQGQLSSVWTVEVLLETQTIWVGRSEGPNISGMNQQDTQMPCRCSLLGDQGLSVSGQYDPDTGSFQKQDHKMRIEYLYRRCGENILLMLLQGTHTTVLSTIFISTHLHLPMYWAPPPVLVQTDAHRPPPVPTAQVYGGLYIDSLSNRTPRSSFRPAHPAGVRAASFDYSLDHEHSRGEDYSSCIIMHRLSGT